MKLAQALIDWIRTHPERIAGVLLASGVLILVVCLVGAIAWLRKRQRSGGEQRTSNQPGRWKLLGKFCQEHLVQLLSWIALPILVMAFGWRVLDPNSDPTHLLILLGLILAAAILAQFGNEMLSRLSKVGPVEFVQRLSEEMRPEFKNLDAGPRALVEKSLNPERPKLPAKLLYEYEKADDYICFNEWSNRLKKPPRSEKFLELLLKCSYVALYQGEWPRAMDRLQLLTRLSEGKYKAAEVNYRLGLTYLARAEAARNTDPNDSVYACKQSQHFFAKTLEEDPHHWRACFNLAYVQVDLNSFEVARKNNLKTLDLRYGYAPAKYNLAICHIKLGDLEEALNALYTLSPSDERIEIINERVWTDEEVRPLLNHPTLGSQARRVLAGLG